MKSVLISICPKWCERITSGEKTIEVRKTRPKLETPFKCYIYCTKDRTCTDRLWVLNKQRRQEYGGLAAVCANLEERPEWHCMGNGKIIGEFVCDCIKTYLADDFVGAEDFDGSIITEPKDGEFAYWIPEQGKTCLPYNEICTYGNGKTLYGWHISDLKIYDKPKELGEFRIEDKAAIKTCDHRFRTGQPEDVARHGGWIQGGFMCMKSGEPEWCENCFLKPLTRPPQSWCYAEEQTTERNKKA